MPDLPAPSTPVLRRLRPGLTPVLREPGVLQVGLDAPHRALVPDHPDVRRLLAALAGARPTRVESRVAGTALAALERAGLLLDPEVDASPALLARHGDGAAARAAARTRAVVLLDATGPLRAEAARLLATAGLTTTEEPSDATIALVLAEREVARERTDPWIRDGVPHLVLACHDGGMSVGPFVVPGTTACLRCLDAHQGEHDPRRPIVLDQLARRPGPAPLDPLTAHLALAWAVRDLVLHTEGDRPSTWSATVDLDTAGSASEPAPRTWSRHPHCGCAWDSWPARLGAAVAAAG